MSGKQQSILEFVTNLAGSLRRMMLSTTEQTRVILKAVDVNVNVDDYDGGDRLPVPEYTGVRHVPDLESLKSTRAKICDVLALTIDVDDDQGAGRVAGFLHLPQGYNTASNNRVKTAAILLSGAGGGVVGPSSMYLSMGDKLASVRRGIPVLRLDYRFPARNYRCCRDVLSAMAYLRTEYLISSFVLVGWSFGSAPVFTVAAMEQEAVLGCATIAGQTADTSGVRLLSPRPLLLLHGTADQVLDASCAESLYKNYGSNGSRKLHLFEGDDHSLTGSTLRAEEMLCDFIGRCADAPIGDREQGAVVKQQLVDDTVKIELMVKGGDLRGPESVR